MCLGFEHASGTSAAVAPPVGRLDSCPISGRGSSVRGGARTRGGDAGAVLGGDVAARGRGSARRARASPSRGRGRPRPPPRRRSRSPSRAARGRPESGRPRQSWSGARPAMPIATSHWPWRHARPNESVIDHRRVAREPRPAARGRRRRGRAGAGSSVSGAPALEASTPALAHTKPWRVRQISRPASARTSSAASDRMTSTWRGSLPCSAASASARAPGRDVAEPHDAALGLGDDLVGDREHVGRAQIDAGPRSAPRGRRRGGSPAARAARPARSAAAASEHRACPRRARRDPPQRREVVRRVDVEPERRHLGDLDGARRPRARGVAGERPGPERRLDHVRRRQQQRVRARPVAVGDDGPVRRRRRGAAAR